MNCTIHGCLRKYYASGYCQKHYDNNRRRGDPNKDPSYDKDKPCIIEGCKKLRHAIGLCGAHYILRLRETKPGLRAKEVKRTADWKKRHKEHHAAQQSRYGQAHRDERKAYLAQWKRDNWESYKCYLYARKQRVKQATPKWADLNAIQEFYRNCPKGYHVDHIEPINGKDRSGLHVIWNLQYLLASENLKKSNKTS